MLPLLSFFVNASQKLDNLETELVVNIPTRKQIG